MRARFWQQGQSKSFPNLDNMNNSWVFNGYTFNASIYHSIKCMIECGCVGANAYDGYWKTSKCFTKLILHLSLCECAAVDHIITDRLRTAAGQFGMDCIAVSEVDVKANSSNIALNIWCKQEIVRQRNWGSQRWQINVKFVCELEHGQMERFMMTRIDVKWMVNVELIWMYGNI